MDDLEKLKSRLKTAHTISTNKLVEFIEKLNNRPDKSYVLHWSEEAFEHSARRDVIEEFQYSIKAFEKAAAEGEDWINKYSGDTLYEKIVSWAKKTAIENATAGGPGFSTMSTANMMRHFSRHAYMTIMGRCDEILGW